MGWKGALRSIAAEAHRSERRAIKRQNELKRQIGAQQKSLEHERAALEVELYEITVEVLLSVHKDSGQPINWKSIQDSYPPAKPFKDESNQRKAQAELDAYSPNMMDKLLNRASAKRKELDDAVTASRELDERQFAAVTKAHASAMEEWNDKRELATRVLDGDKDAYIEVNREMSPFAEIQGIGTSIGFEIIDATTIHAQIHVNGEKAIPSQSKSLLKSGKVSVKDIPKTQFYALYQDYVCSCVLRVGREAFALLPLDKVIVTAIGGVLDTSTGHTRECPILSVMFRKDQFSGLNFSSLDPSDALGNFQHTMGFKRGSGFSCVDTIGLDTASTSS
jgi:hypothetical protein